MTIGKAMKFIDKGQADRELRDALNRTTSIQQLHRVLAERDLSFSAFDFEEAYNNRLVNCQTSEQASQLQSFKQWWETLHHFLGVPYGSEPASGECESTSQCAVAGACKGCSG